MKEKQRSQTKLPAYYSATVLLPNGQTKFAHGMADDIYEFELWLRAHHEYTNIIWHQTLPIFNTNNGRDPSV